jgi:hypothetical protein
VLKMNKGKFSFFYEHEKKLYGKSQKNMNRNKITHCFCPWDRLHAPPP